MVRFNHWLFRSGWRIGQWFTRRLTPAGLLAVVAVVLGGVVGIDTELTLAYQLFAYAVALLLVGWIASWRLGGSYRVDRHLPRFATVGEPLRYRSVVHNDSGRPRRGLWLIERAADPRPAFDRFVEVLDRVARYSMLHAAWRWQALVRASTPFPVHEWQVAPLAPLGQAQVEIEFVPKQRGTIEFAGCWLTRRDPLGLFRACMRVDRRQSLLVLPRRYPVPEPALPGNRVYQHGGVTFATGVGDSEEFLGLLDYRPGDPPKHVHWKSFARTGRPIVREYQSEFFERHALVLDTFVEHPGPLFEEAVSVAASFACTIDTRESLLDLLFVGERSYCYTAGRGHLKADGLLEVLAHVVPARHADASRLVDAVAVERRRLSGCILVLLAWDEPRQRLYRQLRASGLELIVLVIVGADQPTDPPVPGVARLAVGRIAEGLAAVAARGGAT